MKQNNAVRKISFGELVIGDIAKANLQRVIDSNWASEGPMVHQFEDKWSSKFDYKHSMAMSSGTDACINACMALYDFGAQRGDEIICPALTFVATANAILTAGFLPVFVDIDRNTLNINPKLIEQYITKKTCAIMAVHIMGKPCDMDPIMDLAEKHNLFVFGDSCEAHGAKYRGEYVGKIEHVAMFSFYAAHIVVCGEGGMCSTDHDDFADVLKSTRTHGRKPGDQYFNFMRVGLNSRMNDLEASIGLEGLHYFDQTMSKRRSNKVVLTEQIMDLSDQIWFHHEEDYEEISPHAFPIVFKADNKDKCSSLYKHLESKGIQCKTLFGSLPTQHEAFRFMGHKLGDFPEAEYVGRNGLHFGLHQYLTADDMLFISDAIHDGFHKLF